MLDKIEVKQVPSYIVRAFTARYGKIGQRLDESDWLDLFDAWYAGWMAGIEGKKAECSTDTTL